MSWLSIIPTSQIHFYNFSSHKTRHLTMRYYILQKKNYEVLLQKRKNYGMLFTLPFE